MTFKDRLNDLVKAWNIKNGLVDRLSHNAYEEIKTECEKAASGGCRKLLLSSIEFEGSRGGYFEYRAVVENKIISLLKADKLDITKSKDGELLIQW